MKNLPQLDFKNNHGILLETIDDSDLIITKTRLSDNYSVIARHTIEVLRIRNGEVFTKIDPQSCRLDG